MVFIVVAYCIMITTTNRSNIVTRLPTSTCVPQRV
jgi:hypothetical protein